MADNKNNQSISKESYNPDGQIEKFARRQFGLGKNASEIARLTQKKFDTNKTEARDRVMRVKEKEGW